MGRVEVLNTNNSTAQHGNLHFSVLFIGTDSLFIEGMERISQGGAWGPAVLPSQSQTQGSWWYVSKGMGMERRNLNPTP